METVHYKTLFLDSFRLFAAILKKYFIVIIALASVYSSYSAGLYYIFQNKIHFTYYTHIYNAVFFPIVLLFLFACIDNHLKKKSLYDFFSVIPLIKRCYLRLVIYYAMINILVLYGSTFLLYILIFIKIPFVEAMIYFNNTPLFAAIKESHGKTQGKVLRYLMILLFLYFLIQTLYLNFVHNAFLISFKSEIIKELYIQFIRSLSALAANCYFVCLYYSLNKEK